MLAAAAPISNVRRELSVGSGYNLGEVFDTFTIR